MSKKKKLIFAIPIIIFIILFLYIIKEVIQIVPLLKNADENQIKEIFTSFGPQGAIVIVVLQTLQLILGFIPSGFVQVAAGLTYNFFVGGLLCTVGIILGSSFIYGIVKYFNIQSETLFKKSKKLKKMYQINNNKHKVTKLLFSFFLIPMIPYGIICYFAATLKISFKRYITICAIGTAPSIYLSTFLGNIVLESIGDRLIAIIAIILVILVVIYFLIKLFVKIKHKEIENMEVIEIEESKEA